MSLPRFEILSSCHGIKQSTFTRISLIAKITFTKTFFKCCITKYTMGEFWSGIQKITFLECVSYNSILGLSILSFHPRIRKESLFPIRRSIRLQSQSTLHNSSCRDIAIIKLKVYYKLS